MFQPLIALKLCNSWETIFTQPQKKNFSLYKCMWLKRPHVSLASEEPVYVSIISWPVNAGF